MTDLKADLASLRIDRNEAAAPMTSRKRWPIIVAFGAAIVMGLLSWRYATQSSSIEVHTASAALVTPIDAQRAGGGALLSSSGYIVARRKAVVSAKIQGRLASLHFEEGDRVNQGDIIAELENNDASAQVARAQAAIAEAQSSIKHARAQKDSAQIALTEAQRQLRWKEKLYVSKVATDDDVETTRSKVKLAEAELKVAQASEEQASAAIDSAKANLQFNQALLDNTIIRAPFAGTIVKKMAEVGESVAPIPPGVNISTATGAIVALADLDTLEIETDINESNVAKLQTGQPAEVTVEAFPDKKYQANLRQILPTADRTKATVQVKVTIIEKDPALKPEMSARVTFLQTRKEPDKDAAANTKLVAVMPSNALVKGADGDHVFELRDGIAHRINVKTGGSIDSGLIVEQGLVGTETLVINPPPELNDGDKVKVIP